MTDCCCKKCRGKRGHRGPPGQRGPTGATGRSGAFFTGTDVLLIRGPFPANIIPPGTSPLPLIIPAKTWTIPAQGFRITVFGNLSYSSDLTFQLGIIVSLSSAGPQTLLFPSYLVVDAPDGTFELTIFISYNGNNLLTMGGFLSVDSLSLQSLMAYNVLFDPTSSNTFTLEMFNNAGEVGRATIDYMAIENNTNKKRKYGKNSFSPVSIDHKRTARCSGMFV